MKNLKILLAFLLTVTGLSAQPKYITTSVRNVGPGVVHTKMICPTAPYAINVLKIDLSDPYIHLETVKAKDQLYGYEGTSMMSARKQTEGHLIVGAINGDFYGEIPINTQVLNGEVLRSPISLSTFGVDIMGKPYIEIVNLSGSVVTKTASNPIQGVNQARNADQMILFNSYYGSSTGTNVWGREALVEPLTSWIVNDTVLCVVDTVVNTVGNMSIPKGKAVLSAHGTSSAFLSEHVQPGDTIKICVNLLPSLPKLVQAIGGYPKIVKDGQNYAAQGYSEEGGPDHAFDLHPRTAVGFSQDEKTAYFITVDGRITTSKGMSLPELADLMIGLGVYRGINLDGGGSTTMVVRGIIQNTPSGGAERTVSNALMAVTTAPVGELTSIQVDPQYYRLYDGNPLQFSVTGWDDNFNPVSLDPAKLSFQIDSNIGSITSTGKLTASGVGDSGCVYITYDTYKDTARIYLKNIGKINISPDEFMIDTIQVFSVRLVTLDEDNLAQNLARNRIQWEVLDPTIGTIDTVGNFHGLAEGSTKIVDRFGTFSDTISVIVQIGSGDVRLNSMEAATDWTVGG
ncbi:MAG: phosphodiester glycosidase family protein, partial [Candidatus Marinimicrobia bacterium]|nr:phosphodiester glycosidase family protein [Candidatus Neomarinimicrobiota bacterium]